MPELREGRPLTAVSLASLTKPMPANWRPYEYNGTDKYKGPQNGGNKRRLPAPDHEQEGCRE